MEMTEEPTAVIVYLSWQAAMVILSHWQNWESVEVLRRDSAQSLSNTKCKNYLLGVYPQHGNFLNAI